MSIALIVIVIFFVAGILLVSSRTPIKKSRDQFLKELTDYVDGEINKIEGMESSYRISFNYHDTEFFFEDVEDVGFRGKVNRCFLKTKLDDIFNLSFYERKTKSSFRSEKFTESGWSKIQESVLTTVIIPKAFYDLEIDTNNYNKAKNLFLDEKARNIMASYKNYDSRKYPFLSLRVVKGILILEFHPTLTFAPNILSINNNVSSIDDFLNKMIILVKAYNKDYS